MSELKHICLNRLSIGALPVSYWESLSYEEQILWIQKQINDKIIPMVNELAEKVDSIDINFDEIKESIRLINETIETINSELDTKASKDELNNAIEGLDSKLTTLINSNYQILKEYVDLKDESLQEQIDNFDAKNVIVYDPTTGLRSPVQVVIDNIYNQTRTGAISASEYDALQLTAQEYDDKELTAFNYDTNAKNLLQM